MGAIVASVFVIVVAIVGYLYFEVYEKRVEHKKNK